MPSVTVVPNADGTGYTNWTVYGGPSTRYGAINNGVDSPDDTDYLSGYMDSGSSNEISYFGFEDMPGDFLAATSVIAKVRQKCVVEAGQNAVKYQLFQSDGSTALSNEIELDFDGSEVSGSYRTDTLSFTRSGATSITIWSGVQIKITHVGPGDDEDPQMYISEMQLEIAYTSAAAGKLLPFIQSQQRIEDDTAEL